MYSIDQIIKVEHEGGRVEIIPCDATIELIALNLREMGLSLPLIEEKDDDILWEYLVGLDVEIGQVESDGIFPTEEYNEQTGRAVDEFNLRDYEYIDYDKLNERIGVILEKIGSGNFEPCVKDRWRKNPQ